MATQLFANNAKTVLASGISAVATSLTVTAGTGLLFPVITGSDYFLATLCQLSVTGEINFEIVKVTARTSDVFTIVRAQEGTTGLVYVTGDKVELRLTKETMERREATSNKDASGGYPGLTLFKLNLRNAADTFTSWFTTAATAARTWTLPDKSGTVAMTSDITGTNSGVNTGDQTNIPGNAATVTTNADMTGVVTSDGNTTAIADAALSIAKTSGLQTALNAKALLAGSAAQSFSAGTAAAGTNTTQVATTAFVFSTRTKIISATRAMNSASGNVSYTGVGFTPRKLTVQARASNQSYISHGMANATENMCSFTRDTAGWSTGVLTNALIYVKDLTTETKSQVATIVSMDADGFTLAWVNTGTPTGYTLSMIFFCEE